MRSAALPKRAGFLAVISIAVLLFTPPRPLYADDDANFAYIGRGLFRIVTAAFQVPQYLLEKTFSEPIGLGTVDGALTGTYYAVSEVLGGLVDIGRGTVPYAKYAVFFL